MIGPVEHISPWRLRSAPDQGFLGRWPNPQARDGDLFNAAGNLVTGQCRYYINANVKCYSSSGSFRYSLICTSLTHELSAVDDR